jgi:hypothetical protein
MRVLSSFFVDSELDSQRRFPGSGNLPAELRVGT